MDKRFFIELSHQERIRVYLKISHGRIVDIVIQLESWNEKWYPVIRYDSAHESPHKDLMYKDGRKEKEWLHGRKLEEIVNEAIDDLRANWKKYLGRLGYYEE